MGWGVAAALLANVFFSSGFVLEKRALSKLPELSLRRPLRMLWLLARDPGWLAGCACLALGFAAQLLCYRTLPLAAAQGILVTGLVLLLLLSNRFLGERLSRAEWTGIGLILVSLVMIVGSLDQGTDTVTKTAPAVRYLAVCVPSLVAGVLLFRAALPRGRHRVVRGAATGVAFGVGVGLLYGVSSLAIKGLAGLADTADPGGTLRAAVSSPYPWTLLFTGAAGLVMSQVALQRCRASLVVPVCTTANCLHAIAAGTVVFAEPLPADAARLALRLTGIGLAVAVLLALSRERAPVPAPHVPTPIKDAASEPG